MTRSAVRDVLRTVRRHRGLLAAGLTAAAVATALPVVAPDPAPTTAVVAAARDLAPGTPLTATDVHLVALPSAVVPLGAQVALDDVLGRSLAGAVRAGEALTDVRLLGSGLVREKGLVAVPVRLADPATAALLRTGDHVDVLAAATDGAQQAAATVASGLEVLAVPAADTGGEGALVVLSATPDTAARLAAAAVGSRLSVTVRGT